MPDAAGNFKGISVPELPWLRDRCERCEGSGYLGAGLRVPTTDGRVIDFGPTGPSTDCPDCEGTGKVTQS